MHKAILQFIGLLTVFITWLTLTQQALEFSAWDPRDAFNRWQRQRVDLITRAHNKRLCDRQRKRQADREVRSLPRNRGNA